MQLFTGKPNRMLSVPYFPRLREMDSILGIQKDVEISLDIFERSSLSWKRIEISFKLCEKSSSLLNVFI